MTERSRELASVLCAHLVLGFFLLASSASADPRLLPGFAVDVEEWTLMPIFHQYEVESIVAIRDTSTAQGDNINVVWFQRDNSNATWNTVAWDDTDPDNAVAYIESFYSLAGFVGEWPVEGIDSGKVKSPTAPRAFADGLFADDPELTAANTSSNPKAYVQNLEDLGWAAATVPVLNIAHDFTCDEVVILDAITLGLEYQLLNGGDGELIATEAFQDSCQCGASTSPTTPQLGAGAIGNASLRPADQMLFRCCWPSTWTTSGPTASCTATGPWTVSDGPDWLGGSQCSMTCWYSATGTCTCTRTRKKRKLNCATCTWTQTGSYTGTLQDKSVEYFLDCNPPPAYACPGPEGSITIPYGASSCSGWTPGPPC